MIKKVCSSGRHPYFVVGVDAGFYLPVKDELHQFIFQGRNSGVERLGHFSHVGRHVWTEVLDQGSVPNLAVQGVHVWGNVHV